MLQKLLSKDSLFRYLLPLLIVLASYPLLQLFLYLTSLPIPPSQRGEDALYVLAALVYFPIAYAALAGSIIYLCIGLFRSVRGLTKRK